MLKTGIYSITNIRTGLRYIGSATNISKRFGQHKADLNKNIHDNKYLQNAWNKYWGVCSFKFEIIELCEKEKLIEREQFWIDTLNCVRPNGYNLNKNANSNVGMVWSAEARANMSNAQKGRKLTPAQLVNHKTLFVKGYRPSKETLLKISNSLKGKRFSEAHRAKLSASRLKYLELQKNA